MWEYWFRRRPSKPASKMADLESEYDRGWKAGRQSEAGNIAFLKDFSRESRHMLWAAARMCHPHPLRIDPRALASVGPTGCELKMVNDLQTGEVLVFALKDGR